MAARRGAASAVAKRSGCTSAWSARRRASSSPRSSANRRGRPNSRKSSIAALMSKNKREGPAQRARQIQRSVLPSSVQLHAERLSAPAAVLLARIQELEALVQTFADEVELGAVDVRQALRVDDHLHAMVLEDVVFGREVVGVLKLVGQARAAGRLDA